MDNIRNFAIIAHVDHGKSTLADRLLEKTGTITPRQMKNQLLDSNPIERERGITIKLAPVQMHYQLSNVNYQLNLIDTPGHVDFSYEVSRSLAACEGAVILVDATQGVQAQTLAHFTQARKLNLKLIPVINKIDINTADVEGTRLQMINILGIKEEEIILASGKTGQGVDEILRAVIERIPSPEGNPSAPGRGLVFNSNFDPHLGVIAWVRLIDGTISDRDRLYLLEASASTSAIEIGCFIPEKKHTGKLSAGEVGYVVTGLKDLSELAVGDTVATSNNVQALPGYQPIQPVVFVGLYLIDGSEINELRTALGKLKLSDSALTFEPEFSPALGNGFRVGLLGLLHADIVQERLEREFNLNLIATAPAVGYEIVLTSGQTKYLSKASDLPDPSLIDEIREPMLQLAIFVPETYVGGVMQLCQSHRGEFINMTYLQKIVELEYLMPFSELIRGFYDQLKSVSSGFATIDYELIGYRLSDLVKLDIVIAEERIDALSQIVPRERAIYVARDLVEQLKDVIPRQQFEVPIQAAIGAHVLARSDVKAFRKDVLAKMSGGDQTRKDKLLKKQAKGKARMKRVGSIDIPQEAFLTILKVS